jgi:rubrerythrin
MHLDPMLARCQWLEERAAAAYRSFAATARSTPSLCALWTALAREEEEHARSLVTASASLRLKGTAHQPRLDGWEPAMDEVERCLRTAEELGPGASTDRQLAAALDLEMTELEALRHALLAAGEHPVVAEPTAHALRLAEAAGGFSNDPHVALQAALLRARVRLQKTF